MVTMTAGRILETKGLGFCMPLGKDSKTEDGFSPSLVLVDEYHAHPSDDMLHVMESGTVKRESPLVCIITTAGKNPYSPCAEFEKKCKSAMDGDFLNPQLLPVIYDLDDGDDWRDPSCWIKANPSLGVTITLDALKSEFEKAITEGPQKESDFKTKNLNVWVHSDKPWIPLEVIRRCRGEVDEAALSDRVCFGGLDLSRSRDITAFVLFFPASEQKPGNYAVFRFFCPKENAEARSRKDGVPYLEWAEKGRLILTPGDVIDTDYIANYIRLMRSKFTKMHSIAFDRWRALPMVRDLNVEFGAVYHTQTKEFMEGYSQTTAHFNAPLCELERLIYTNDFIYDGSEVFEWMMRNVRLYLDTNGNAKVDKAKSTDKVDGVVALLMAMGQWMTYREHMKDVFSPDSDIILI
jgi:phage terminase large subunit-like protein